MALARYRIRRGRPVDELSPRERAGVRIDTRKHTRHFLRPPAELVDAALRRGAWEAFERGYFELLEVRFRDERAAFDALSERARRTDVFLGCSCPTAGNPDVRRCHTVLALRFMAARYPDLEVELP